MTRTLPRDTPRIGFRCWRPDDLPLAERLWGDPQVTQYLSKDGVFTPRQIRARFAAELEYHRQGGVQYWVIADRSTGAFIGCCGLRPRDPARRIYEHGFQLVPVAWGRGLAREAARAVYRHAFDELGATSLFAGHHPANARSRTLLTTLGFRLCHSEYYAPTGLLHPGYQLDRPVGWAWRTEGVLHASDGDVRDLATHRIVRSPRNPGFWWGNYLLLRRAPRTPAEVQGWQERFREIFRDLPGVRHLALGVDCPEGDLGLLAPLVEQGWLLEDNRVLHLDEAPGPSPLPSDARIVQVGSDRWDEVTALNAACDELEGGSPSYDAFKSRLRQRYRDLVTAGRLRWWAVERGGKLVAQLGLVDADGTGRYQSVETHPAHRRKGLARALVAHAAGEAVPRMQPLVLCVAPGSVAEGLYLGLGFRPAGWARGVVRPPA